MNENDLKEEQKEKCKECGGHGILFESWVDIYDEEIFYDEWCWACNGTGIENKIL